MKLSQNTITILKNFNSINQNIAIYPNKNYITTISDDSEFAKAMIDESFPHEICLYNLGELLNIANLTQNPDFIFTEKDVIVREEGAKRGGVRIRYSNKDKLNVPPDDEIDFPDAKVSCDVPWEKLNQVIKTAAILGLPNIQIEGNEEGISIRVFDRLVIDGNKEGIIVISNEKQESPFSLCFQVSRFKMLPNTNYTLNITDIGVKWVSENGNYEYIMAAMA